MGKFKLITSLKQHNKKAEKDYITEILKLNNYDMQITAVELDIALSTLYRKTVEHSIKTRGGV